MIPYCKLLRFITPELDRYSNLKLLQIIFVLRRLIPRLNCNDLIFLCRYFNEQHRLEYNPCIEFVFLKKVQFITSEI